MTRSTNIWRPPDKPGKEKAARGVNPGSPEIPNPGGTGKTKATRFVPEWQRGIAPALVAAVGMHRICHPRETLPAPLQRQLARAWLDLGRGAR
jgi:hypothetical protein